MVQIPRGQRLPGSEIARALAGAAPTIDPRVGSPSPGGSDSLARTPGIERNAGRAAGGPQPRWVEFATPTVSAGTRQVARFVPAEGLGDTVQVTGLAVLAHPVRGGIRSSGRRRRSPSCARSPVLSVAARLPPGNRWWFPLVGATRGNLGRMHERQAVPASARERRRARRRRPRNQARNDDNRAARKIAGLAWMMTPCNQLTTRQGLGDASSVRDRWVFPASIPAHASQDHTAE